MWNPKIIVLLTGKSGSGKDFFYANRGDLEKWFVLIDISKSNDTWCNPEILPLYERYSFANRIKEIVGVPTDRRLNNTERIEILKKAFEMKETFGDSVFVDYVVDNIRKNRSEYVMITDCRFPIEYTEMCKQFPDSQIVLIRVLNTSSLSDPQKEIRTSLNSQDTIAETSLDSMTCHYYTLRRIQETDESKESL